MKLFKLGLGVAFSALFATSALAGTLVINSDQADPAPREAFAALVEQFKQENPDIDVKLSVFDKESYKTQIRNWLAGDAPDIVNWYAGERMKFFAERGLFEDISDLWAANNGDADFASTAASVKVGGKVYGVPTVYYNWGVYYRTDLFEQAGITEAPKDWDSFLAACKALRAKDIAPVTIGTKYLWTAGGWFDYLNLRVNGYDYHMDLTAGKVPYNDAGVKEVFAKWKEAIDAGCFIENHANWSWQEAQAPLYQGKAAMYLMGNFITPAFPADVEPKMDFFQFPMINDVPVAEDAPTDTIHIPSKAKNKDDAKKFIAFMMRPDVQEKFASTNKLLPTNKQAKSADDRFLKMGKDMLDNASFTAQFYDRDSDPNMANEGMKGFQEFMIKPERVDDILDRLEKRRAQIYKN